MPFKKGAKHPNQGGKRLGAGRKSKEVKAYESKQAALAWAQFNKHRPGIMKEKRPRAGRKTKAETELIEIV